jgi:predicted SnoaL-like aldol condensation-catalyzing enzyme
MKHLSITNLSVCLLSCSLFVSTAYANNLSYEVAKETKVRSVLETGLQALYVDADAAVVDQYFAQDYIQHNPFGLSGVDFVKNVFIVNRPEGYNFERGVLMVDGNYGFGFSRFTGFTSFFPRPIIAGDVYRVENGKIVEHWDVVQQDVFQNETLSGNAMFSFEPFNEYVPEWQEKRNQKIVFNAVNALASGNVNVIERSFSPNYIEHDPAAAAGKKALLDRALQKPAEGFKFEIGFLIADGSYVVLQTRTSDANTAPVIAFDLYRLADNLIVEHWKVVQNEVPAELTATGNPMFPVKSLVARKK